MSLLLISELHRRNVIRVGIAYVAGAWLLIQIAETIFPAFGFGETAVRNVVIVLAVGFVLTVLFSWVFEITPEGLKRGLEVEQSESITPQTGKKLDRIIMVTLALALAYFAVDKFVIEPKRDAALIQETAQQARSDALVESYGDKSIAVMPFVDMSSDKDQEYMSDGIAEELLNLLASIPDLRVISRTSAFSFKGQELSIPEIAKRLQVDHILEGSVRKAGLQLRITAQLIDARSDTHLWSKTYDRTLDNIFTIQDEIAAAVVEQLKVTLLGETPKVQETDPEAYALLLQARHLELQSTAEGFEQSNELYQQALAIDPDYVAAWNGLAGNYNNQASHGLRPIDEGYALAREAASTALAIDPDSALAHAALGWIAMAYDGNLAAAAQFYERALKLDPANPTIISASAVLAQNLSRPDEAIALKEFSVARDPVNPGGYVNLGLSYLWVDRTQDAITSIRSALNMAPGMFGAHYFLGRALLLNGESGAALLAMQQEPFEILRLLGLAEVQHALGQAAESDAALAILIEKYAHDAAYNIAYVLAFRGETDRAFEWLDKAVEYKDPGLAEIQLNSLFSSLYDDPRWLPFLESLGKSPAQLDAIQFELELPEQENS